ncbi:MAG: RDD family protein [Chloroflexi bacterium]|nr:RDD family protein [Chloroflexota bacterium]
MAVTEVAHNPRVELASQERRLLGNMLDGVLLVFTLGIGWLVWYLIVATRGQSPAKQLLGMRVITDEGEPAGLFRMLIRRELLLVVPLWLLAESTGPVGAGIVLGAFVISAAWCIWDSQRQCLWDKLASTVVVLDRDSLNLGLGRELDAEARLQTLASLHRSGAISQEEYRQRAREIEGR